MLYNFLRLWARIEKLQSVTFHMDHTVLPAAWHRWTRPALTQPCKPVLDLPTPEG